MLVDTFLYAGEADMLDLRIQTLSGVVDRFVAVCSTMTHQGAGVLLPDLPTGVEGVFVDPAPIPPERANDRPQFWIERQHRNAARLAAKSGDVVMVSDVDEIPDPKLIPRDPPFPQAFSMRMHGFAIDYQYPARWNGTTVCHADQLAPQFLRNWRHQLHKLNGGWHLSWMGDMEAKKRKLATFAHAELAALDLDACMADAKHANGEPLKRLTREQTMALDWPAPMFDGFTPPASWWSKED